MQDKQTPGGADPRTVAYEWQSAARQTAVNASLDQTPDSATVLDARLHVTGNTWDQLRYEYDAWVRLRRAYRPGSGNSGDGRLQLLACSKVQRNTGDPDQGGRGRVR